MKDENAEKKGKAESVGGLSLAEAHVILSVFATEHQALAAQALDEQQRNRLYWLKRYIAELQVAIQREEATRTLPPGWWDKFAMPVGE